MICVSGEVRLDFDNGLQSIHVHLEEGEGLEIPPGLWRSVKPLDQGAKLLVLASDHFDESDYIRDYASFERWKHV
jgi:hypothetical protein